MIYLPDEITEQNCAYVYDTNTIRVYERMPANNTSVDYTDYFINSNYITRTGTTNFNSYSTLNYNCLDYTQFTTNYAYRNDFANILIIALIIIGVIWYLSATLIKTLLKGRKRY